jgi:hypothetical protein
MKTFCEGGMSTEVNSILLTEDARLLAEARLIYAATLKDRFLRSPARFLLQDQDAAGIEKLERRLVQEIDAALRFSCQLWCRRDTPQIKGLRELSEMVFNSSNGNMELCRAQAPLYAEPVRNVGTEEGPPGYHDGHSVIMVVQPSVGVSSSAGTKKDAKGSSKIWAKASVFVASPKPAAASPKPMVPSPKPGAASPKPAALSLNLKAVTESTKPAQELIATQDASPPDTTSIKAMAGAASPPLLSPPAPPVPPKDSQDSALILLPNIAFKDLIPRPLRKQSPRLSLAAALAQPPRVS